MADYKHIHSWIIKDDNNLSKTLDKSAFLHRGTAVPKEICTLLKINQTDNQKKIVFLHKNKSFDIRIDSDTSGRIRLFWSQQFSDILHHTFPKEYSAFLEENDSSPCFMHLQKQDNDVYKITLNKQSPKDKKQRNPKWVRDELILALNLYFQDQTTHGNSSHPKVQELSDFLNSLNLHPSQANEKYRNANGVGMKLTNFRNFDPNYDQGLSNTSKLDRSIWDEFSSNTKNLEMTANAIRINAHLTDEYEQKISDDGEEATEGKILTRIHKMRERDSKIIKRKKEKVLQETGKLSCEACGFDFQQIYGERGKGFAECHHIKAISSLAPNEKTKLSDLAILCANCHRMIHREKPWLTIFDLKNICMQ